MFDQTRAASNIYIALQENTYSPVSEEYLPSNKSKINTFVLFRATAGLRDNIISKLTKGSRFDSGLFPEIFV